MSRNLILTGGLYHPFDDAAPALASLLESAGIESTVTSDVHAGLAALGDERYDLLTVYALRWPMRDERFDADRARWGVELGADDRQHIERHVAASRGVLALHTAAICFDDWPGWRELVGTGWAWGRSHHPPLGAVRSRFTASEHPITAGLPDFELTDEAYTDMDHVEGLVPLAEVRAEGQAAWSPSLWAREVGASRVVYDALGHDRASLEHPVHRRIVARAALWALRRPETQIREA